MIQLQNIGFKTGKAVLLSGVHQEFGEGEFWGIIGPNGAGKSSLLKMLGGVMRPTEGNMNLGARDLSSWNRQELARIRAFLTQNQPAGLPFKVEEVVMMGRYPWFKYRPGNTDKAAVHRCMELTGITHLKGRNILQLSGGELKRVHLARVLAQIFEGDKSYKGKFLLLDEPLNDLDIKFQFDVLKVARQIVAGGGLVIMVIHDLNLAFNWVENSILLHHGRKLMAGKTRTVLSSGSLQEAYGVKTRFVKDIETGQENLMILPENSPRNLNNSIEEIQSQNYELYTHT